MAGRPRVLLVDDALVIRSILSKILAQHYDVIGDVGNGREALNFIENDKPDLVMMDVTMPIMDGIEATRQISQRFPDVDVVILSAVASADSIRSGLAAGARDYLQKPPDANEILKVLDRITLQRQARRSPRDGGGLPGAGIWSFIGAKAGDGRTTLMISMANELLTLGRNVVCLDADLIFGDVGFYLDIESSRPTLGEVLDPQQTLNEATVKSAIKKHPSGLNVLATPPLGNPTFGIPAERVIELVHLLNRSYDYVLVDHPDGLPDGLLPLVDDSRYIFAVSRGLPERLRAFKIFTGVLGRCGFVAPRMVPVLTRTTPENAAKLVESFKLGVADYLPSDVKAVEAATQQAQPVTRIDPRSPYTQAVREFVGKMLQIPKDEKPADEEPGRTTGLLGRLFGK